MAARPWSLAVPIVAVLFVAARLTCTLCGGEDSQWSPSLWQDTWLRGGGDAGIRRFRRWRNWLTGEELALAGEDEPTLHLADLFAGAG